jgi:hypothetical protein
MLLFKQERQHRTDGGQKTSIVERHWLATSEPVVSGELVLFHAGKIYLAYLPTLF